MYKGTRSLDEKDGFAKLSYQSVVEPNSLGLYMVSEYLLRNFIPKRFESMADRAVFR